ELSISESAHALPTADVIDVNETISITKIVNEARELQSLFSPCEQLVKQTQSPDFSEEIFTIDFNLLSKSLKDMTIKIEQVCEQQTSKIEQNRGVITTVNQSKFVSRDPSDNKKYNDDELRYLVSCGPYHDLNLSYPQNLELKKKNKQCSFTTNWCNDFPYLEYSLKKDAVFCFCCRLFGSDPGSEKSQQAWISTGASSWSKMTGQNGKLVKHFKSTSHMTAENRSLNFSQKKTNIDLMLNAGRRVADQKREEVLKLNEKTVIT
ncbi:unnamed protein product, partial [Rotaria sp. Silwood2]